MKKSFLTGLAILLPLAVTFWIIAFLFNLLTDPFLDFVKALLPPFNSYSPILPFVSNETVLNFVSKTLILFFLFFITMLCGFFARWVFVNWILKFWDRVLHRIPFVRSIYKICQDVIRTIFVSDKKSFKQVVIVPFPHPGSLAVGLVTQESVHGIGGGAEGLIAVFVPTTPNPTSGFLTMYRQDEVIHIDMPVEEAFKYVISCGVIVPPFRRQP